MLNKARIIKASALQDKQLQPLASGTSGARVIKQAQVQAQEAAEHIREKARTDAEKIRTEAQQQAQQLRAQAHAEGYAEGMARATAECVKLATIEAQLDSRSLQRSVEMARVLAERLLGREMATDPSAISAMAAQVLSEVRGASRITLYVSPIDHAELSNQLGQLGVSSAAMSLEQDEALSSGDFRLATNVGSLEATLGSRLALLSQKLHESLKQ